MIEDTIFNAHIGQALDAISLSRFYQTSNDGITIIDAHSKIIQYVNPQQCRMTGYSQDELIGQHVKIYSEGLPTNNKENPMTPVALIKEVEKNRRWQGDVQRVRKNGEVFWAKLRIFATHHETLKHIWVSVMEDIHDQKQTALELEKTTQQLSTISSTLMRHMQEKNWSKTCGDLVRLAMDITGSEYGFAGVKVGHCLRLLAWHGDIHNPLHAKSFQRYARILAQFKRDEFLDLKGLDNLFGQALLRNEVVLTNTPEEHPYYTNSAPPGHIKPDNFLGIPVSMKQSVTGMIGLSNTPGGFQNSHIGDIETLTNTLGILFDSYLQSLKEQKQKDILKEHQKKFEQQSRLANLGEMAGGIAHEINQPISAISNYARGCLWAIRGGKRPIKDMISAIESIVEQSNRAGQIIHRIRSLIQHDELNQIRLDIHALITRISETYSSQFAQHQITFKLVLSPPTCAIVYADMIGFEQLFHNLIKNAIDALDELPEENRWLSIETKLTNKVLTIRLTNPATLKDNIAINELFNPLVTTKANGMGLGLSICASIIRAHEGKIQALFKNGIFTIEIELDAFI